MTYRFVVYNLKKKKLKLSINKNQLLMYFSVAALIIYKGRYLFQKRDKKKKYFIQVYTVYLVAIIKERSSKKNNEKELFEEINIKFKKIKYFLTIKLESDHFNPKNFTVKTFFYL